MGACDVMRITSQGKIRCYVAHILQKLQDETGPQPHVHLVSATSATISKLVTVVEIVKRHEPDVVQLTTLFDAADGLYERCCLHTLHDLVTPLACGADQLAAHVFPFCAQDNGRVHGNHFEQKTPTVMPAFCHHQHF
eukprot:EG_transcript_38586